MENIFWGLSWPVRHFEHFKNFRNMHLITCKSGASKIANLFTANARVAVGSNFRF